MNDVAVLADVVADVLLDAVAEGGIAAGVAADLARLVVDGAAARGVDLDELLELTGLGSRR